MIWNDLTRLAFSIACTAHNKQVDKSGVPYILHPLRVAQNMPTDELAAIALLHDVIEDTSWTADALLDAGVPSRVVDAVVVLTRNNGVSYESYIQIVKTDELARIVKKSDLRHNSDPSRWPKNPTDKDRARMGRYYKAFEELIGVPDYY